MFDTHEFVATLKSAGASEEQATLALRAVSKALDTTTEGFVKIDALTDLKLAMIEMRVDITSQLSEMRAETSKRFADVDMKFGDMSMKIADLKSETADIKSVKLIAITTLSLTASILMAAIAAVVKQLL